MGNIASKNAFRVDGKVIIVTGGSRGLGLELACQLAEKGGHIVIVGRDQDDLKNAIERLRQAAADPETQRFHYISADLTAPTESQRAIKEVASWNGGNEPDIVWCCAGGAYPALFIDTPPAYLQEQMEKNYYTALYMAHATISSWVAASQRNADYLASNGVVRATKSGARPRRHLIFTSSLLGLYSIAGYAPYSPCKAALRTLSDTLSQEVQLYNAAFPGEPAISLHTIFPAAILTAAHEIQDLTKPDITKALEGPGGQTPAVVAAKAIKSLETGLEMVTTDALGGFIKSSVLGGSVRGGFLQGLSDWLLSFLAVVLMVVVRRDMDRKTGEWGRTQGIRGVGKRT